MREFRFVGLGYWVNPKQGTRISFRSEGGRGGREGCMRVCCNIGKAGLGELVIISSSCDGEMIEYGI